MAHDRAQERVLALDVRSRKVGFVVFEGPDKLLDWGVTSYAPQYGPLAVTVSKRIASLLGFHQPSVMVLRLPSNRLVRKNGRIKIVLRTLRKEARRRSVLLKFLRREKVKKFFMADGLTTKHQIASLLVERFPDLAWKLPPKRKPWQSEAYGMTIFDGAAAGVAHFGRPDQHRT
jgi:hypothetical protein